MLGIVQLAAHTPVPSLPFTEQRETRNRIPWKVQEAARCL